MKTDSPVEVKRAVPWQKGLVREANGVLSFAGQSLTARLGSAAAKVPCYLLSLEVALSRARAYRDILRAHLSQNLFFHFAVKSNTHPRLLERLAAEGFGADVVSGGEFQAAAAQGFLPSEIVFSGVAKTELEIREALRGGVGQINLESFSELQRVTRCARELGVRARVAIRFNPEVKADTHPYIATGFRENKFGVDQLDLPLFVDWILAHPNEISFQGLSLHIGSQLLDFSALSEALQKTLQVEAELRERGLAPTALDVGGGVGISYRGSEEEDLATLEKYAGVLRRNLADYPGEIRFEPGRFWVARAGVLLARVEYVKRTPYKNFLILNTGMNALIRPMLYQAYHRIEPLERREGKPELFDVVGPVCESSDVLGTLREFHDPREGDLIAIGEAGAYGAVLSSRYNLLGDVPELIWEEL